MSYHGLNWQRCEGRTKYGLRCAREGYVIYRYGVKWQCFQHKASSATTAEEEHETECGACTGTGLAGPAHGPDGEACALCHGTGVTNDE